MEIIVCNGVGLHSQVLVSQKQIEIETSAANSFSNFLFYLSQTVAYVKPKFYYVHSVLKVKFNALGSLLFVAKLDVNYGMTRTK